MARLSPDELIDEYEWLTTNGMSPLLACEQLGKSPAAMARFLYRYGRNDLATRLEAQMDWRP